MFVLNGVVRVERQQLDFSSTTISELAAKVTQYLQRCGVDTLMVINR